MRHPQPLLSRCLQEEDQALAANNRGASATQRWLQMQEVLLQVGVLWSLLLLTDSGEKKG